MPVAVRNPLDHQTIVHLGVKGVPKHFAVHFPHAWIWMDSLEERKLELIIISTKDYQYYLREKDKKVLQANVRL